MVSVFFFVGEKLIIDEVHISDAKQEGNIFKHPKSHKELWDELYKEKYKVEYDFYPRGEVIYKPWSDTYIVYKDPCIELKYIDNTIVINKRKYSIIDDERFLCNACRTNSNIFGAICGDILGSTFEFEEKKYSNPDEIDLFRDESSFTDDTILTLAVTEWLLNDINNYEDDEYFKEKLAKRMVDYVCKKYKNKVLGYGASFWQWCNKMFLTKEYEPPYNSYGNGSAMRVSPVGWFFDTMEETMRFAKISADVTHNHPEGEKGAMCIAAAVFLARKGKSKQEIKEHLISAFGYTQLDFSAKALRNSCSYSTSCQETVPLAVVAFLESTDFESAVRIAISFGSDSDTIAAMAGAIAEAYYKEIPLHISRDFCKYKLDKESRMLCKTFFDRVRKFDYLS